MPRIFLDGCHVDLPHGVVTRADGGTLHLTPNERALFRVFVERAGEDLPRADLLNAAWGYAKQSTTRALDTAMKVLRRKLEVDPKRPRHLLTVWGVGYRFEPLQRPRTAGFIGHDASWERLARVLSQTDTKLVTIGGPAGVGKSRLAREYLGSSALWLDLSNVVDSNGFESALGRCLDGPLRGPRALSRIPLLVLDNAEHLRAEIAAWLDTGVMGDSDSRVVLTSRRWLGIEGEVRIEVRPLAERESVVLFSQLAEVENTPQVRRIVSALDGLPAWLELAASRLRVLTLDQLDARIHDAEVFRDDGRFERFMRGTWSLMEPAQQRVVLHAACFSADFAVADLEALCGTGTLAVVDVLVRDCILKRSSDGLRLSRAAREALGRIAIPDEVHRRAVDALVLKRSATPASASQWRSDLIRIVFDARVEDEIAVRAGLNLFSVRGILGMQLASELIVHLEQRSAGCEPSLHLEVLLLGCTRRLAMGNAELEDFEEAVRVAGTVGGPLEAWAWSHLGSYHRHFGDRDTALSFLRRASEAIGDSQPQRASIVWIERAVTERRLDAEASLVPMQTALKHARAAGEPGLVARVAIGIGGTLMELNRLRAAKTWFEEARVVAEEAGRHNVLWQVHSMLAWQASEAADFEAAERWVAECLAEPSPGPYQSSVLHQIQCLCALATGDDGAATRAMQLTRTTAKQSGDATIARHAAFCEGVWRWLTEHPDPEGPLEAAQNPEERGTYHELALIYLSLVRQEPLPVRVESPVAAAFLAALADPNADPQPSLHLAIVHRWRRMMA